VGGGGGERAGGSGGGWAVAALGWRRRWWQHAAWAFESNGHGLAMGGRTGRLGILPTYGGPDPAIIS
jgi:hypothetical protein